MASQVIGQRLTVLAAPRKFTWRGAAPEEGVEVPLAHVLKEEAHGLADGTHAQELHDVGVLEAGQGAGLPLKVPGHVGPGILFEHLHGNHRLVLPRNELRGTPLGI